jgi:hypothetical protein
MVLEKSRSRSNSASWKLACPITKHSRSTSPPEGAGAYIEEIGPPDSGPPDRSPEDPITRGIATLNEALSEASPRIKQLKSTSPGTCNETLSLVCPTTKQPISTSPPEGAGADIEEIGPPDSGPPDRSPEK